MPKTAEPKAPATTPAWGALLSDRQTGDYLGISRALVWRWVSTGELPKPINLPGRVTRWRRDDLDKAIAAWAKAGGAR